MKARLVRYLLLLGILSVFSSLSVSDNIVRVHYNERPPYLTTVAHGIAVGLTATPAMKAFQASGIQHQWVKTPSNRQIAILEKNAGKDCLVGWFKNPQREKFALYSHAIYQDKPSIALALFSNTRIESGRTMEAVFKDPDLLLLVKDGYSYGSYIDGMIEKYNPKRHSVLVENTNMLQMINVTRADYFFTAEEEADGLIRNAGLFQGDYKYIRFPNTPAGNKRYILCSKKVGSDVIDKLNSWIDKTSNR